MKIRIYHIAIVLMLAGLVSCSAGKVAHDESSGIVAQIVPENPENLSSELNLLSKTVQKLEVIAFYRTYVFSVRNTIELDKINDSVLNVLSITSQVSNQSVSGTATVIYYDQNIVGMLTCAHVVDFPDTIVLAYNQGEGPLKAISIKVRQQNYVNGLPFGEDVEVVASDRKLDIALLKKQLIDTKDFIPVLNYLPAKKNDLDWGTPVYVMGFPLGKLMVTRGLVSKPSGSSGRFLTDALYNRGISGSPVITFQSGNPPETKWAGIASSAAAQKIYYLKPGKNSTEFVDMEEPYAGELYLDRKKMVNYGVTYNITSQAVLNFLKKNRDKIVAAGFDPELFFK